MTEKQQQALDTVFSTLPEECRESYREIADYVISLGCKPVLRGAVRIMWTSFPPS